MEKRGLRALGAAVLLVALLVGLGQRGMLPQQEALAALHGRVLQQPAVAAAAARLRALLPGGKSSPECSCGNVTEATAEEAACNLEGNVTDCCEPAAAAAAESAPFQEASPARARCSPEPSHRAAVALPPAFPLCAKMKTWLT